MSGKASKSATLRKVELPKETADGGGVLAPGSLNPRRMRRIIAEDTSWNMDRVPSLVDLCVGAIVRNFKDHPVVDQLPEEFRQRVLNELSPNLPLDLAVKLIDDEAYWKRAAGIMSDQIHDVSKHGGSWKRLFFEKYVENMVEAYVPGTSAEEPLHRVLALAKDFVVKLNINSLQPPAKAVVERVLAPHALPEDIRLQSAQRGKHADPSRLISLLDDPNAVHPDDAKGEASKQDGSAPGATGGLGNGLDDNNDDDDDEDEESIIADHLDISAVAEQLPNLEALSISYRAKDCGMKFNWSMFGMTSGDAQMLAECAKYSPKLASLTVTESMMNDRHVRRLASKLLDDECLKHLDLSHNEIADKGARGLAKLLNGHSKITYLCLADNRIAEQGAQALAMALRSNNILATLDLRLNNLGDKGAFVLFKELAHNTTLTTLNVSSNNLTHRSVTALSEMLEKNKSLKYLDITCNELGDPAGKALLDALERNSTLVSMDMRMTGFSQDTEISINEVLSANMQKR